MCDAFNDVDNFEGWYVIFDELSPHLLHKTYCAFNNSEEFVANIEKGVYDFGDDVQTICSLASVTTISRRKLIKCARLTQLMQIVIFSYRITEKKKICFSPIRYLSQKMKPIDLSIFTNANIVRGFICNWPDAQHLIYNSMYP